MKVVFMGTPAFAVPSLRALLAARHEVVLVVTQPDRRRGRSKELQPPPVKIVAEERGLEVYQPETLKGSGLAERIKALRATVGVVVAYGHYLGRAVRKAPKRGTINVHASLLPRHRGAAPIAQAILDGDERYGVSIMEVARRMDAGRVYAQSSRPARGDETCGTLTMQLAEMGARLLVETLAKMTTLEPWEQDESQANLVPKLTKADGDLDWTQSAAALERRIRALDPWPGTRARYAGQPVAIEAARVLSEAPPGSPGEVVAVGSESLIVRAGEGALELLQVKPAGKRSMDAGAFARGRSIAAGDRFENVEAL